MAEVMKSDFILTARAKGLSENNVIRIHAFRNALLPMITLFSQIFPAVVSGSVILETIFSIPGMGLTIFQAIGAQDYPVIIAVFFMTGVITMTGFLLTDILYAFADPRISYSTKMV
jgi:peptide/nickel transport system permease protein